MRAPLLWVALAAAAGGAGPSLPTAQEIRIHYLGHASFVLAFPDGTQALTDYGESHAWGLDSPIHSLGGLVPDVVTISHEHADHAGGPIPSGARAVLRGGGTLVSGDLRVSSVPTHEGDLASPDNASFLFEYQRVKILHLGDCQGLMIALAEARPGRERDAVAARIRSLYPHRYDLVLLPIGFTRDILAEAADFATLLDTRFLVPMHYWNPGDRDAFLALLERRTDAVGRPYRRVASPGPDWRLAEDVLPGDEVGLVGLTPGPWSTATPDQGEAERDPARTQGYAAGPVNPR